MFDFPPTVPDLTREPPPEGRRQGHSVKFADPDTRSPSRFLLWLLGQQVPVLIWGGISALVGLLPVVIGPYVVGRVVDEGIIGGDLAAVVWWCLLLFAVVIVAVVSGILSHAWMVQAWLSSLYATVKLMTRKTTQMGHLLPQRTPTGEVLSVASSDSDRFGHLAQSTADAIGALAAYLVVTGIVLSTSPQLGLVVLVGAPLLLLSTFPLLRPMHRRQEVERTQSSELTSLATDIVGGLRILRGIGGESRFAQNYANQSQRTRRAGVAAGNWQAGVDALKVLVSGLFLVTLTWLGARQVLAAELTLGQLISFFGYAIFIVWPVQAFFILIRAWVQGLVSAAKTVAILSQEPPWSDPEQPQPLPAGAPLHDEASGFTATPGQLSAIVSASPDAAAALADRLGRYLPPVGVPVTLDDFGGQRHGLAARTERLTALREIAERDIDRTRDAWGVRVGGVDLAEADLAEVRRHVMVSDASSTLFAGTLQSVIDPHRRLSLVEAEEVLWAAAAHDVFESLPGGWQGIVEERGRGLSGGQQQRLVLARALAVDPEILILVEPTSAVDAHTEALIAERLGQYRQGRTTVVVTGSPLLLHHADRVSFVVDDIVVAEGTHEELLNHHTGYRSVVMRSFDETPEPSFDETPETADD